MNVMNTECTLFGERSIKCVALYVLLNVFYWMYCTGCIVLDALYWMHCTGCIVLDVLYWMHWTYSTGYIALDVLHYKMYCT